MKKMVYGVALFLAACSVTPTELPVVAESEEAQQQVSVSPKKKIILNADHILNVLGEPTVKRRESPAEVWVYSQESCVLFIYMNDKIENPARVKHMEIGTPSFNAEEKKSLPCLKMASRLR